MRAANARAASRRGWVCAISPARPRPSSRQYCGSWVLLPEPVSPATIRTWWTPERIGDFLAARGNRQIGAMLEVSCGGSRGCGVAADASATASFATFDFLP